MAAYKLIAAADQDFETIFEFGIDTFGIDQALIYQTGMMMRFDELAQQPILYNAVDHIQEGYRRSVFGSHSINYRLVSDGIVIVRILGRQDPKTSLST